MVHGREGTERCLVYVSMRFRPFFVLLLEKKHAVVWKNHVNMCLCDVLTYKL